MTSFGLFLMRVVVGGIFAVHGYTKLFGGPGKKEMLSPTTERVLGKGFTSALENGGVENTAKFMESLGLPNPQMMALALSVAEFGGGLALVAGWNTRLAASALAFSQGVAIKKVHGEHGLIAESGYELNAALIASTACLALSGPGAFALD